MKDKIKQSFTRFKLLLQSVPPITFTAFILSIFSMNLLANKSIDIPASWLALDCGIVVSWIAFLCMDVLTKHFGPKAATQLSLFAVALNLLFSLILFAASKIPGNWGQFYELGSEIANDALNNTIASSWFVVLGSTVAFIASAVVNNFTNYAIGKAFVQNPDGFGAYACRTYVSTAIGQFVDNLIFALIVSHFFFGWTIVQCLTCAATGMVAELILEIAFSPLGHHVCKRWQKEGVGKEYLDYVQGSTDK